MPRVRPKYELCVGFDEDVSEDEAGGEECSQEAEATREEEFDIRRVWCQLKREEVDRLREKEDKKRAGAIRHNN